MKSEPANEVEQLAADLVDIRQRFAELSLHGDALSEGYRSIAEGLGKVLEELDGQVDARGARLQVVLRGLDTLADLLSEQQFGVAASDADGEPSEDAPEDPAAQFRQMFRKEALKRLKGLSISMMGIFSARGSADALEQTAEHLHALKGTAGMVGLSTIADLVRAMEEVVLDLKEQPAEQRTWPTRALLRGFHLLEDAANDPDLTIDEETAAEVTGALNAYVDTEPAARAPAAPAASSSADRDNDASDTGPASIARWSFDDFDGPLEHRILIVDDIETIAASVGFVLSELDVPIDMAENGEEALAKLKARPYSLVVSDVSMPRMDGIAMTKMIRSDERMDEIPVVLLTSLDHPNERNAGMEAGATDYIIKGKIGGGELLERVRELLEIAPKVPAGDFRSGDEQSRILIAEDVETIAASIAFVLSEGPFEIEIARNGAAALEKLKQESYDLLLSDVQMPEMSGLELVEAVRATESVADMPVILLTSLEDPEVQRDALERGADRFLIKGRVAGERLLSVIEEVLHRARGQERRGQ